MSNGERLHVCCGIRQQEYCQRCGQVLDHRPAPSCQVPGGTQRHIGDSVVEAEVGMCHEVEGNGHLQTTRSRLVGSSAVACASFCHTDYFAATSLMLCMLSIDHSEERLVQSQQELCRVANCMLHPKIHSTLLSACKEICSVITATHLVQLP